MTKPHIIVVSYYSRARMPVVVYPINPSSTRVHSLFGLVGSMVAVVRFELTISDL